MQAEKRPNGQPQDRHWWYESEEVTAFPHFMNDGYAPPDWDLLVALEMINTLTEGDAA